MASSKGHAQRQLALLLLTRLVEPLALTILFSFVNPMVEYLKPNLPLAEVGKYSGFLESVFSLASFCLAYQWGRWSDKIGRKPTVLCGLVGAGFSLIMLGLSRTYWMAMIARVLAGGLCGNMAVLRAALGETTTRENESWVYPLWSLGWDVSVIAGPVLGSALSFPPIINGIPHTYHGIGSWTFFQTYPFFAPCAVVASYAGVCFLFVLFFFEETLPAKGSAGKNEVHLVTDEDVREEPGEATGLLAAASVKDDTRKTYGSDSDVVADAADKGSGGSEDAAQMSAWQLVRVPAVFHCMVQNFLLCFTVLSFDAAFVLFCYSPIDLQGLALSPSSIAASLSLKGALSISFALLVFPILQRKIGTTVLMRAFTSSWIFAYLIPIGLSALVRNDSTGRWVADGELKAMWGFIAVLMVLYTFGDLTFPLQMIALNIASPDSSCLGKLNGLSLSIGALARSIGPACMGWLYSYGAEHGVPLVWLVFGAIATLTTVQSFWVKGHREEEETQEDGNVV